MAKVQEEIPQSVLDQFSTHVDPGEEPQISVASDMEEDGTLGERWVIVTSKRVLSLIHI